MGFSSLENLHDEAQRLAGDIRDGSPMSVLDWTRALLATEIAFASSVLGTGVDEWGTISGGDDDKWIRVLRRLQMKVPTDRARLPG